MLWVLRRWIITAFVDILSLYDIAGSVLEFGGYGRGRDREYMRTSVRFGEWRSEKHIT
jgi:hypothetical protein